MEYWSNALTVEQYSIEVTNVRSARERLQNEYLNQTS